MGSLHQWKACKVRYEEANAYLKDKLGLANAIVNRRDNSADIVSAGIRTAFPEWAEASVQKTITTYPARWPEAGVAATRIHWDLIVRVVQGHGGYLALVAETYPRPRVLREVTAIAEFAPGDAASTVQFLKTPLGSV